MIFTPISRSLYCLLFAGYEFVADTILSPMTIKNQYEVNDVSNKIFI